MKIHRAIIHQLIKKQNQKEVAEVKFRQSVFDDSSRTLQNFGIAIQSAYAKKSKATGRFDTDLNEYPFQKYLSDYVNGGSDDPAAFVKFTRLSMTRLRNQAKIQVKATGGYVFFLHYEVNQRHFMMVMLLSQKHVFNIEDLDLKDLEAIDLDTLRYAVRIDLNKWSELQGNGDEDSTPYLSFLRGSAEKVADYFQNFVGCTDYSPSKQSTDGMILAVRSYLTEVEGLDTNDRRFKDKELLDYCSNKINSGEMVSLTSVSGLLNPEAPERFVQYVDERELFFPDYFEVNRAALRTLKSYHYKGNSWDLRFDHSALNNQVQYNAENNTIVIRNVPSDFAKTIDIVETDG